MLNFIFGFGAGFVTFASVLLALFVYSINHTERHSKGGKEGMKRKIFI